MNQKLIDDVAVKLTEEKEALKNMLPQNLQDDFTREAYISGGCIYSLYNSKEPKDYDFFVKTNVFSTRLRAFFLTLVPIDDFSENKSIYIVHYKGQRVVVSKNAISIGKYQIITKFFGEPEEVINEFDFKHNMFWHESNKIHTLSDWDFLDSNYLIYNEKRARDISGTIIRVHKFVERGMKITNAEMAKMLKKLREVGFTERENEIIENVGSYN